MIKIDDFLKISNYETSTNALINLIEQRLLQENMLIFWIKQGFLIENPLFNPFYAPDRQKPGPLNQKDYNDSIKSQRSSFLHLFKEGNTIFLDNNNEKVAFIKKKLQTTASIVKNCIKNNIVPFNMKSEPKCQIQINHYLPISYGKLMLPTFETPKILQYSKNQKKIIALGIPLATKKRVSFQEISLKKFLLDSLIVTVSKEERGKFIFILYIAYDEGDPTLDFHNDVFFKELQKFTAPYKSFLHVKLYRIPPIQRVATIWNILFVKAVQEGMHYFYQLNDDIQFITTNWATKLTSMLDSSDGYGVAGPSDLDNEWNCRVLTQGMVTIKHYQLFNELLYPTEFINWKSDRWLTQLYRRAKLTHCDLDIKIRNGNHKTRYDVCDLTSTWKNYLFEGRRILEVKRNLSNSSFYNN